MTEAEVLQLLRKACGNAGSNRAWALANDLSPQYVGDVLAEKRQIGPSILKALGLEVVTVYRKVKR